MTSHNHLGILLVSVIAALALAATFAASFRGRGVRRVGSWPIFLIFFLPILLASWSGALWLAPAGPMMWGVYWVPILCVGLAMALVLASFMPRREPTPKDNSNPPTPRSTQPEKRSELEVDFEVGSIFVVALIFFALLLLGGLLRG